MPPWKKIRRCWSSLFFCMQKEMVDISPLPPNIVIHSLIRLQACNPVPAAQMPPSGKLVMLLVILSVLNLFSEPEGGKPEGSKGSIWCITLGMVILGERLGRLMGPLLVPAVSKKTRLHLYIEYFISKQDCIKEWLALKAGDTA